MPAFAEMPNNSMFTFRKVIEADLEPLLQEIPLVITHDEMSSAS
jgi:hypothetical protein